MDVCVEEQNHTLCCEVMLNGREKIQRKLVLRFYSLKTFEESSFDACRRVVTAVENSFLVFRKQPKHPQSITVRESRVEL